MRQLETKIYSYKMSHDTRFAPNPFFNVLTLSTCKPVIRKCIGIGNWIAGWTSKGLTHNPTEVGAEKLIYLAKVTKKLTYAEYWKQYPQKRPLMTVSDESAEYHGDNIYKPHNNSILDPMSPNAYVVQENSHLSRTTKKQIKDLSGLYVLICEEFYYFSCLRALNIPDAFRTIVAEGRATVISKDTVRAEEFINYVRLHAEECRYTDAK